MQEHNPQPHQGSTSKIFHDSTITREDRTSLQSKISEEEDKHAKKIIKERHDSWKKNREESPAGKNQEPLCLGRGRGATPNHHTLPRSRYQERFQPPRLCTQKASPNPNRAQHHRTQNHTKHHSTTTSESQNHHHSWASLATQPPSSQEPHRAAPALSFARRRLGSDPAAVWLLVGEESAARGWDLVRRREEAARLGFGRSGWGRGGVASDALRRVERRQATAQASGAAAGDGAGERSTCRIRLKAEIYATPGGEASGIEAAIARRRGFRRAQASEATAGDSSGEWSGGRREEHMQDLIEGGDLHCFWWRGFRR
ncbi:hypothetical protein Droror1_Dr00014510 [Drosera rotundifolia]